MRSIPYILILAFFLGLLTQGSAQEKGSDNKWVLTPLSLQEEAQLQCLPQLVMPAGYANRELPAVVDNSLQIYMRPAYQQAGLCCGQASCIGYNFTYEMSRERDLNASLTENQYPTHFAWNFMNGGDGYYGVSYLHSIQILKDYGMPNVIDYGGTLSYGGPSRWMSGYTQYYNGMHNRISNAYQLQVGTPEGLLVFKHWLHSHLEGSPVGGIASFYAQHMSATSTLPAGTPESGKYVLTYFGGSPNHAMTIVGYNDSIRWDYNSDGQYTNSLDINGDDTVDMKDWEIGGFKMVQSYGGVPNWGNQGYAYMMYKTVADNLGSGGIWNHCVHVLDVKESYDPKLTAKITLKHTRRIMIKVLAGISNNVSQPKPQVVLGYPIYDYHGGNKYMQGGTTEEDKTITFGLDLSKLLSYITLEQNVKVFLQVVENDPDNGQTGEIIHFSIFDHTGSGTEIICPQINVPLVNDDTTTLSITHNFDFNRVTILDGSIPPAPEGEFYSYQLSAGGGTPPYTWEFDKTYEESTQTSSFPLVDENQLTPTNNTSGFATQEIDFDFPYYDSSYSTVSVHVDGYLMFDGQLYPFPYYQDDKVLFNITRNISPFLFMNQELGSGCGIWYEGDDESATFRWKTTLTGNSSVQMNYAVSLYPNGNIKFYYGAVGGCDTYQWMAGISDGDNYNYQVTSISAGPSIAPNTSTTLIPYNYPDEMALSESGLFTGTPVQSYGNELITFKVTDNNFIFSRKTFNFTSTGIIVQDSIVSGGDQIIAFGETAWMSISVLNVRQDTLTDADLTVHISDPYITLADSVEFLGDILPGEERNYFNVLHFNVSEDVPDGHLITIQTIIESDTNTFESNIFHYVYAPVVSADEVIVTDENGRLDAGDTTGLNISFLNSGGVEITSLNTLLSTQDPYITINENFGNIPVLGAGQVVVVPFNLSVSEQCPPGHSIAFSVDMTGDGNYYATDSFNLVVGLYREDFETGDMKLFAWGDKGTRDWTIDIFTPFEGYFSAKSGVITHNEESVMVIDMNVLSDGQITFYERTSCENDTSSANNFDYLCFRIDGVEQGRWDGETSWSQVQFPVTAGYHRFEWIYHKDDNVNYRFDAAWVDLITFPSAVACSPALVSGSSSLEFLLRTGESETATLLLTNPATGDLAFEADIAGIEPLRKRNSSGSRNIEGSYLVCNAEKFHTGVEYVWNFRTYNGGNDNEWIKQVYIYFPSGTDLVAASDFVGGSGGNMVYDGLFGNGVAGHWFGEDANGWGVVHMGETAQCDVSVIPQLSLQQDITLDYDVQGEIYGGPPHNVTGTIPMRNLGPVIPWLSLDTLEGNLPGAATDSLQITVNAEGMADGEYQAWIVLQDNFENEIIIPVTMTIDTYMYNPEEKNHRTPQDITIFPNPFREVTNIIINHADQCQCNIYISDMQGRIVSSFYNISADDDLISLEWKGTNDSGELLPAGIYYLHHTSDKYLKTAKVIIIR
jgi:hypothetical protein